MYLILPRSAIEYVQIRGDLMSYLNELDDELLEEFVYEYDEQPEEIDVDEIISSLKKNISEYIFENPEDMIFDEPLDDIDYDFEDIQIPDEMIEKLEPKDDIFVDK